MFSNGSHNMWLFVLRGAAALLIGVLGAVWLRLSQTFLDVLYGMYFHPWLPEVVLRPIR